MMIHSLHNNGHGNPPTTSSSEGYRACAGGGLAPAGGRTELTGILGPSIDSSQQPPPRHHQPSRASQQNVKVKRKCIEVICQPSVILLGATVVMTAIATVMLSIAFTTKFWEQMEYDPEIVNEIAAEGNKSRSVQWLFNGRLPLVTLEKPGDNELIYLVPVQSGVWISCIDLEEFEFDKLTQAGYRNPRCMDHLSPDSNTRPTDARAAWQFRMQNLGIACAMVCLILLGSAIFVGLFGIFRIQISAVLVTGVIYVLAALFAIFTLAIVHVKHKNRIDDYEPLDVWTKLIPDMEKSNEFRKARKVTLGWSLELAWAGVGVCVLASVMWMSVSKMMRYNPISLVT